jgi:hypothetical protein
METRTINILPTSFDSRRAFFTIPEGTKYLTNKIRLADFELLNGSSRPIYFNAKGFYTLIKSISFLNSTGNAIDSMQNTDYIALKILRAPNSVQRDVSRILYQNNGISVDCPSLGSIALNEQTGRQDATKIGGYLDLSFMSEYLQARQISTDQLQIQIEWIESSNISGGWAFSRPPTLFVDEVLSGEPTDAQDVIVYNTIVSDFLPVYPKFHKYDVEGEGYGDDEKLVKVDRRMNAYNQQMIKNLYFYFPFTDKGKILPNGFARAFHETTLNCLIDGKQVLPFGGLNTDAKLLSHITDHFSSLCLPGAPAYYANMSTNPDSFNHNSPALINPNTEVVYNGVFAWSCLALNQVVLSDIVLQYAGKVSAETDVKYPEFLSSLAEVARYYKRSTGMTGNFTPVQETKNLKTGRM